MSLKILIVESHSETMELLVNKLGEKGYVLLKASHGKEALSVLQKDNPQLIISALEMPEMDGMDLYQHSKNDANLQKIPFVMMTAKAELESHLNKLGISGVVLKPVNTDKLCFLIASLMSASSPEVSPAANPQAPAKADGEAIQGQGFKKILLAEKSPKVTKELVAILQAHASEIVIASKEQETYEKAMAFHPDLVVMNMLLGELPANNIVRVLRKKKEVKNVPIVVYKYLDESIFEGVSSFQIKALAENAKVGCLNAGPNKFIVEYNPEKFLNEVKKFLV